MREARLPGKVSGNLRSGGVEQACKSGVSALWRSDSGPLAAADLAAMGLASSAQCWAARGHDGQHLAAVHEQHAQGAHTIVVGELEQLSELAARLGMAPQTPPSALVAAALERYGTETPAELSGEWSLLQRRADGSVIAMLSAARRDPLLWAQSGPHWALHSDLFALARIDWVNTEIDETGLLARVGRDYMRQRRGARTMLVGVSELRPGESLTVRPDGSSSVQSCDVLTPQPAFSGSFADALTASDELLARIMRERLARTPRGMLLLSGGLDSSLLAAYLAGIARTEPQAVVSVAPPESGLADEEHFARMVADRLGLPLHCVAPAAELNAYRPPNRVFAGANGPAMSNRHCITQAIQQLAGEEGVGLLINGTYGELTATARLPDRSLFQRLRTVAASAWHHLSPPEVLDIAHHPFHVRVAPHRLANLPEPISTWIAEPREDAQWPPRDGMFGYLPGAEKALMIANEFHPGAQRMSFPYRDVRLLRLFAGFPLATLLSGGHDRPVVRNLLTGRVPEAIRLRQRAMPATPDHLPRLQRQAESARARIPEFRRAELDEWLDLNWLDEVLSKVAARGPRDVNEANQVQLTAMFAEFMLWWRTQF